jgi:uncharacterized membrane protein YgcG
MAAVSSGTTRICIDVQSMPTVDDNDRLERVQHAVAVLLLLLLVVVVVLLLLLLLADCNRASSACVAAASMTMPVWQYKSRRKSVVLSPMYTVLENNGVGSGNDAGFAAGEPLWCVAGSGAHEYAECNSAVATLTLSLLVMTRM